MTTTVDRQTHDRCKHPTLGEGTAIYDNGPARFVADSGEVVAFASIRVGGASTAGPMKSWLRATTEAGEEIRLDTSGRKGGDRHRRIVTIDGRRGWGVDVQSRTGFLYRFDRDDGETELYACTTMHVGTPREYRAPPTAKWVDLRTTPWMTAGSFTFCLEEKYPGPEAAEIALHGPKAAKAVKGKKERKPQGELFSR